MKVYIEEYANDINYVESYVGEVVTCCEFDYNDTFGILGEILKLISEKSEFRVTFEEEY